MDKSKGQRMATLEQLAERVECLDLNAYAG